MRFLLEDLQTDSNGNELTPEQIKFFKDSKIVNKENRLIVMYHGTNKKFNTFDSSKFGKSYDGWSAYGEGFYFTDKQSNAKVWADKSGGNDSIITEVYLNIKNPFDLDGKVDERLVKFLDDNVDSFINLTPTQKSLNATKYGYRYTNYLRDKGFNIRETLIKFGYDGIYSSLTFSEVVAFYPNQIKSIDNRNPTSSNNINEAYGYRTETAYGSGVRDLEEVVKFEIVELGNVDIPDTLLDTFDMTDRERESLEDFSQYAEDYSDDEKEYIAMNCINIINNKYPNAKYALWLADKEVVKDYYDGTDEDIDTYVIPDTLPISDLGYDGQLYIYDEMPKPINTDGLDESVTRIKRHHGSDVMQEHLIDSDIINEIEWLENYFNATIDVVEGATYITPSGKFLDVNNYKGKYRQSKFDYPTHDVVRNKIKTTYAKSHTNWTQADTYGGLPLIRCNDGLIETIPPYIDMRTLDKITIEQYDALEKWLWHVYEIDDGVEINVPNGSKTYIFDDEITPDYIISRIKRYYVSGNLYESLSKHDDSYQLFDTLPKNVYHATTREHLKDIMKNGLKDFWIGQDVEECIEYVKMNHDIEYEDIVAFEIPKKLLNPNNCDFTADFGDGWSDEWSGTFIYYGIVDVSGLDLYDNEDGLWYNVESIKDGLNESLLLEMPEKVDKMKLSQEQDRRVKLTTEQKEEIKKKYAKGGYSLNSLAQEYNVSKKTILLIVNPSSKEKNDARIKAHWQDYYNKEEHAKAMKSNRDYKKELVKKGELK